MRGFTILEILITLGIIVIITTSGVLSLSSFRSRQDLDLAGKTIIAMLRDAQSRADTQEGGTGWGVRFQNGAADSYMLYQGPTYTLPAQTLSLKSNLEFRDPASGATKDVLFERLTGYPSGGANVTIIVGITGNPDATKTITIFANGRIEAQ